MKYANIIPNMLNEVDIKNIMRYNGTLGFVALLVSKANAIPIMNVITIHIRKGV